MNSRKRTIQAAQHPAQPSHPQQARRATVADALLLGQQLGEAVGAARMLIDNAAGETSVMVDPLRRWYHTQHPEARDRRLWLRFTDAVQIHTRLEQAIHRAEGALSGERSALVDAEAERDALAISSLPMTVQQEAAASQAATLRRYLGLSLECQQRTGAISELERVLPEPKRILPELTAFIARMLEAVIIVDREALVQRIRESGELEHLRARLEHLRTKAHTHQSEIVEWSRRAGRALRVPSVDFPWPAATAWEAVLDRPLEAPRLVWRDDAN